MSRQPTQRTRYILRVTGNGQVRRYEAINEDGARPRRSVPGRTTMRRRAIAESIG